MGLWFRVEGFRVEGLGAADSKVCRGASEGQVFEFFFFFWGAGGEVVLGRFLCVRDRRETEKAQLTFEFGNYSLGL